MLEIRSFNSKVQLDNNIMARSNRKKKRKLSRSKKSSPKSESLEFVELSGNLEVNWNYLMGKIQSKTTTLFTVKINKFNFVQSAFSLLLKTISHAASIFMQIIKHFPLHANSKRNRDDEKVEGQAIFQTAQTSVQLYCWSLKEMERKNVLKWMNDIMRLKLNL